MMCHIAVSFQYTISYESFVFIYEYKILFYLFKYYLYIFNQYYLVLRKYKKHILKPKQVAQQECQNVCNTLNHLQGKRNGLFGLQLLVPPPPIGPQGHLVTEFCGKEGRIRHVFRNTSTTAILHVIIMMPPHLTSSCSQLGSAVAAIFGAFYSS